MIERCRSMLAGAAFGLSAALAGCAGEDPARPPEPLASQNSAGFDYINRELISRSDVTIFNDYHLDGEIFDGLFSRDRLEQLRQSGVTDIYLEVGESGPEENLRRGFVGGTLTRQQFLNGLNALEGTDRDNNVHLSGEAQFSYNQNLVDLMANSRDLGIEVHFAMIDFTGHQSLVLRDLLIRYQSADPAQQAALADRLAGQISDFRVENDSLLAGRIMDTRNPEGRAIVVHGASHGSTSDHDLDELLQNRGLSVARANVTYDLERDLGNRARMMASGEYADPVDIFYLPASDSVHVADLNANGLIDAGPSIARPMPSP